MNSVHLGKIAGKSMGQITPDSIFQAIRQGEISEPQGRTILYDLKGILSAGQRIKAIEWPKESGPFFPW